MAEVMAEYGLESVVKLASNESPFPPLPEVKAVIDEGLGGLNRYPDGAARSLRDALADRHAVDRAQVAVGNGSCELIVHAGVALLEDFSRLWIDHVERDRHAPRRFLAAAAAPYPDHDSIAGGERGQIDRLRRGRR